MTTIMQANRQDWNSNGVPGSVITLQQGGILFVNDRVLDTNTGKRYLCTVVGTFDNIDTYTGCEFAEDVDERNLLPAIANEGWGINTLRDYSTVSLAFNTPRTPNSTHDVDVIVIVNITGGALTSSIVNAQIDTGSGFITRVTESVPALGAATTKTFNFKVPAGASYQFTESGTVSITTISELLN